MHRRIYFTCWSLFLYFFSLGIIFCQDFHMITGRVKGHDGSLLMGNVMALRVSDSTLLRGENFLEGEFTLRGLRDAEVLIKLSSIQFADTVFRIQFNDREHVNLGDLIVNDRLQLVEVEIIADVPLFVTRPDGVLQVNVANTVLATSNSLDEILTRAPGVTSDENGLSVIGKGPAIVYLNGKRITQERLASVSAAQVKNIEIISNPSASFDAEGQAVINIITHESLDDGYRVGLNQQFTQSDFTGKSLVQTILNGSFKKGRLDVIGNYDFKRGREREVLTTTRARSDINNYLHSHLQWDAQRDLVSVSKYSLGAAYTLGKSGYASLEYNGFYDHVDELWQSENNIITTADNGVYTSRTNRDGRISNNSLTLNISTDLDTLGSSLFAGGQFSRYNADQDDAIFERNVVDNEDTNRSMESLQNGKISIYSPQVDVVKVLNRGGKLSVGSKLSYAKVSSSLMFYQNMSNVPILDPQRSNEFSYEETIPALYAQYEASLNKRTTIGFGVRSEWTRYTLRTTVEGQGKYSSQYFNLFPTAQVGIELSKDLALRANYTARIIRPRYQALSPTLIYQDAFTSTEGNPRLLPEKVHAFEVGATWRQLDLKTGYSYSIDKLSGAALRGDDEKGYVLKGINVKAGHLYFTSASAAFTTRWLTSNNTVSINYQRLMDDEHNFESRASRPQVYLYSNNKIHVGRLFSVQMLAWYLGEKYYSLYYDQQRWLLTLGIEKELLNKTLKCSFVANDIFHTTYPAGNYHVGGTDIVYARKFTSDYYRIVVTYAFGKLKKTSYKSKSTGEAENSRVQ